MIAAVPAWNFKFHKWSHEDNPMHPSSWPQWLCSNMPALGSHDSTIYIITYYAISLYFLSTLCAMCHESISVLIREMVVWALCVIAAGFASPQRVLKMFPGPGYLRSKDGIVWLWHLSLNLHYITLSNALNLQYDAILVSKLLKLGRFSLSNWTIIIFALTLELFFNPSNFFWI